MFRVWSQVLILLLLSVSHSFSQVVDPERTAGVVCWRENRKLTWNDFQAKHRPDMLQTDSVPGHFVGAVTEAEALIVDKAWMGTVVSVQFDKRKSWVNRRYYFDMKSTLVHEQLHFDIVELTGRKLRQVLARCREQGVDYHTPAIEAEMGCFYDEEADLQLLYDKEAGGGDNPTAQARWQLLIRKELARLGAYKSTAQDCIIP